MKDVSAARILHDLHVYGAAIYGAGNRGKRAYEILSRNCIPVRWVIDQCEGKKLGENDAVQMSHFQNNRKSACGKQFLDEEDWLMVQSANARIMGM